MIGKLLRRARRSLLARNTLANAFGQLIAPLLTLVLVPFYVAYLGLDGYGMIAFFTMLTALLAVFSSGVGWALQREIARRDASEEERPTIAALVRTFEIVYWAATVVVCAVIFLLAPLITTEWLESTLPAGQITLALSVAALRIGLAFPAALYNGVLLATQRQVLMNVILASTAITAAAANSAAVAMTRSVVMFAVADTLVTFGSVLLLRRASRVRTGEARFARAELLRMWRFSASLVWVHGVGVVVKQLDRTIVSKLLPLAALGVYAASTAGGRILSLAYGPFFNAVYPQTCALAAAKDRHALGAHLVRNGKVVLILGLSAAVPLSFFAGDVLLAWTRNTEIATSGAPAMSIFLVGSLFSSATNVLYQGQTALGIARPAVAFNTAALLWFPPASWALVKTMGMTGAAWAWVLYGAAGWIYFVITSRSLLDRRLLREYGVSSMRIALPSVAIGAVLRYIAVELLPNSLALRVSIAVVAGPLILVAAFVAAFGVHASSGLDAVIPHSTRGAADQ